MVIIKRGQRAVRAVHSALLDRGLPDKIGVYFHSIEPADYVAFRAMVSFFLEQGYQIVGPVEFVEDTSLKAAYISFDDCYASWFEALPLFGELGAPVTFYVNTGYLRDKSTRGEIEEYFDRLNFAGPRVPLSTMELRGLAAEGYTIGAHGHSHFSLTRLPLAAAQEDILRSKLELEAIIQAPVKHFAFPFGMRRHFNKLLHAFCTEVGFETVAYAVPALQHAPKSAAKLHRSGWNLGAPLAYNVENLRIDGRLFEKLTGRSAIG